MQRKRYKTMDDTLAAEVRARMKAGLHPDAVHAKEQAERIGAPNAHANIPASIANDPNYHPGDDVAHEDTRDPARRSRYGDMGMRRVDNSRPGGDHMHLAHEGGTTPPPSLVPKGATVTDLGVRANQSGNARSGQSFRDFYDAKGKEFHVYADGTKVGVKPRDGQTLLTSFLTNQQAQHPPGAGQPAPAGPTDTAGQEAGAEDPNRTALAQLAAAVAAQRAAQTAHPELDPRRRRRPVGGGTAMAATGALRR